MPEVREFIRDATAITNTTRTLTYYAMEKDTIDLYIRPKHVRGSKLTVHTVLIRYINVFMY